MQTALLLSLVLLSADPPPAVSDPTLVTFAELVPKNEKALSEKRETNVVHQEKIAPLIGKRVKIDGYILPTFKMEGLDKFILIHNNFQMNFGAPIKDQLVVELAPGRETSFSVKSLTVEGTLQTASADIIKLGVYYQVSNAQVNGDNAVVRPKK